LKFRRRFGLHRYAGLTALAVAALVLAGVALAGAISTTDNSGYVGTYTDGTSTTTYTSEACRNSSTNCNIYFDKRDVWLSGLPIQASLGAGDYFLAVLDPGGQRDPNDGTDGNLSTSDDYVARSFHVADDGTITLLGGSTHTLDNGKIQAWPFADTTNNGHVYILVVCSIPASPDPNSGAGAPGIDPSDCKYDAFKVTSEENPAPPASDLTVAKTATPAFARTFTWGITKSANPTSFTGNAGGPKVVAYRVEVSHNTGVDSGWQVTGKVTVSNPNEFAVSGLTVTENNSSCKLFNGTSYVDSMASQTVSAKGTLEIPYKCTLAGATDGSNTATATWPASFGTPTTSADSNLATWSFTGIDPTLAHACVDVTDPYFVSVTNTTGEMANLCLDKTGTQLAPTAVASGVSVDYTTYPTSKFVLTYSETLTIPSTQCQNFVNTATFTAADDSSVTNNASATVSLCPKVNGLTIGYWQNKNGQARIIATGTAGNCTALHDYLVGFNPFKDIDTITISNTNSALRYGTACGTSSGYTQSKNTASSGIAGYLYDIIKAANASGASMNAMLKAQMLATALNVYVGVTPGGLLIDLTKICHMIDSSAGTATCSGAYTNTSLYPAVFGGATSMTVSQILVYAANQSNAGGSLWYGNVKSVQEKAKDTFDAINNSVAVAAGP
jgi:hypothetical protein